MRHAANVIQWIVIAVIGARAWGHGNPIEVHVDGAQLMVAGGLTMSNGYARLASDPHEDAALDFGPSETLRSVYPGYDVAGLAANAALQFEIIARPDFSTDGHPTRWLWYWDPTPQMVATAANDPAFDVLPLFGSGGIRARQSELVVGPALTMADPVGPFLGADQHLLIYQLQNSPAAASGVYGLFARLASPGLEPSEPILLAFRYGVAAEDFAAAAEAINFAAALPGDYDHNDVVDFDDYNFWRARFGNSVSPFASPDGNGNGTVDAADYVVWRIHFGFQGEVSTLFNVPEPAGFAATMLAGLIFAAVRRQRPKYDSVNYRL